LNLKCIELNNFRSYLQKKFQFETCGCVLHGPNGSGKTNLLEAIAYTSIGKSIRYQSEVELVLSGRDFFSLNAAYETDLGIDLAVQLSFAGQRKLLKVNDQTSRQLSILFSLVKVIYCAPEDMLLVNSAPRLRRQYFDLAISQLWPDYLSVLRAYLHVVEQRNNLLKRDFSPAEKSSWDSSFAQKMLEVQSYRHRYLKLLNSQFAAIYHDCDESVHDLEVDYRMAGREHEPTRVEPLLRYIKDIEPRERVMQRCLLGAHLDDYHFRQNNRSLRAYASQGQKRLTVILLKLIQARLIEKETGILPILLYDDILAELDSRYSSRIKDLTDSRFQVFIASPNPDIAAIWDHLPVIEMGAQA
jgi:DNA replication and repair protein RecF